MYYPHSRSHIHIRIRIRIPPANHTHQGANLNMILKNILALTPILLGCSLTHAASQVVSDDFNNYLPDQFNWSPPYRVAGA